MPLNILIVPDKFKGTLIASAAAEAIARGWRKARPHDRLDLLPMSDGGDGFGEVMSRLLKAKPCEVQTVDAAHRRCNAQWWWEPKTKTAIIESAKVIGLTMLPPGKFHPFELDTFGLGAVIRAAAAKGARRCLIGIGGSATNDGGFGLARALGWKFLDHEGTPIERWAELHKLSHIEDHAEALRFKDVIVAVDVRNPLLGARGATRVYGPQKGLMPSEFAEAEKNLRKLARAACISGNRRSPSAATVPGAGAAGGLGFGLLAFLGARLEPGFLLFSRYAELNRRLRSADLVITGEGSLDASTFMGKGVGEIARCCRKMKRPCVALAGEVGDSTRLKRAFHKTAALTDLTASSRAKTKAAYWLERLAERVALQIVQRKP